MISKRVATILRVEGTRVLWLQAHSFDVGMGLTPATLGDTGSAHGGTGPHRKESI